MGGVTLETQLRHASSCATEAWAMLPKGPRCLIAQGLRRSAPTFPINLVHQGCGSRSRDLSLATVSDVMFLRLALMQDLTHPVSVVCNA